MRGLVPAPRETPPGAVGLKKRDALEHSLLGVLPALITGFVVYEICRRGNVAVDFRHSFWVAGWRTLHGLSPYGWTRAQISGGASFPYPAPTALLLVPFGLLSSSVASVPVTAACVLSAPLALWIVNIRDWRVYGAVAMWAPVVIAWQTANLTLPIVVGTALLWRYRGREWPAAALVAVLVSIKPIMAPLWLWLLLTGRWHTAKLAALLGLTVSAASWAILGWHEFGSWLGLLSRQGNLRDGTGYSLIAVATHLGLARGLGLALIMASGCALAAILMGRSRAWRERQGFGVAILLGIVISPQIDLHYLALLMVPLALAQPRLMWAWLAPVVLWACPATSSDLPQIVLWWLVLVALGVTTLRGDRDGSQRRGPADHPYETHHERVRAA